MTRSTRLLSAFSALFFGLLATHPVMAMTCEAPGSLLLESAPEEDPYAAGTRAMDDQRWREAAHDFDQVLASHGNRSDAALYWKAYSLHQVSRDIEAAASCKRLQAQFAASSWNKDCIALFVATRAVGSGVQSRTVPLVLEPMAEAPPNSDTDLKILALNSLMNQEPGRAVPLLRGILSGNQPMSLKKQVIFILAQSKSPEAGAILHDAVVGRMSAPLQVQAIQMTGIFQGRRASDTLAEVYRTSSDLQTRKAVINALFLSRDAARLVDLARNEKDLELKRSIVSQLAVMNDKVATDYMLELLK
jgi:hypothetical protein